MTFLTKLQGINDKVLHAGGGFLTSLVVGAVSKSAITGLAASLGIGIGKEIIDWFVNQRLLSKGLPPAHDVDLLDIAATVAGGALAAILLYICGWG
jgi:hypothetical protein